MSRDNGAGRRVAVLYTSVEESLRDVSTEMRESMDLAINARLITEALSASGHTARYFSFGRDLLVLGAALRDFSPDAVFNLSECPLNSAQKEPHAAAFIELLRLPYTGNGPAALSLCNDKALAKRVMASMGIATPAFRLYAEPPREPSGLAFPAIVKPAREDGSAGITEESIVESETALKRRVAHVVEKYQQEAIAEEYVGGREFNVAVLGNGTSGDPWRTLPPAELVYRNSRWRVCSFESKWDKSHPSYSEIAPQCPADVDPLLRDRLEETALSCARAFGLCGYARIDMRLDAGGEPCVLEVNPNPDISPDAGLSRAAAAAGLSYDGLLVEILRLGLARGTR
jgi:D-alanine-D-alanine ligase